MAISTQIGTKLGRTLAVACILGSGCAAPPTRLAPSSTQSGPAKLLSQESEWTVSQPTATVQLASCQVDAEGASSRRVSYERTSDDEGREPVHQPDRFDATADDGATAEGVAPALLAADASLTTPNQTQLSVESCVELALAAHPRVLAARARVAAARSRIPQAKALADPMLDNMFWPIPANALQTAGGRMQDQLSVTQQVPWPEKLRAKAAIACREMQIARAEVESIQLEIAESVRLAYYEIWFAERGLAILEENQALIANLIRIAESRYRTGGSQQDVLNAEIERERLQQQAYELTGQREAAKAELAALLQQPRSLEIQTEQRLPVDNLPARLDVLIQIAEHCNPNLRGLAITVQRDMERQRLANLQRYPDFQFGTQYGFMSQGAAISPVADGKDMISFSAGVTLPIWREKIRSGIDEAAAERVSSSQLRQGEQLTIEGRLRRLLAEITALDQQHTLYSERIIPRAEQSLEIASSEYTVGKTSFVQLTENYQELLAFKLQVARFESTIASRMAQVARTIGCAELATH